MRKAESYPTDIARFDSYCQRDVNKAEIISCGKFDTKKSTSELHDIKLGGNS